MTTTGAATTTGGTSTTAPESHGPSASTSITVPCDGNTHTYRLTANGSTGASTSQTISVSTHT